MSGFLSCVLSYYQVLNGVSLFDQSLKVEPSGDDKLPTNLAGDMYVRGFPRDITETAVYEVFGR